MTQALDALEYRRVVGRFATGVTVVTAVLDGEHHAMTCNSFTSVSIDPVLVLFCPEKVARFHDVVLAAGHWAVSVLGQAQQDASRQFARRGRPISDQFTGVPRFTFGVREMYGGLDFVSLAVGLFGLAEIMRNLEQRHNPSIVTKKVQGLWLTREDFRRIRMPVLRGTALGSLLGVLPGGGHVLASFTSYSLEKRISKRPQDFGTGAIEGVAAPESANNAAAQTSFIPLLTLGLPAHPVMALLVGAFIIQGITPGPNVINDEPELFWGLIASFWIGNVLLVMLNLPLIGLWVRMLSVPYSVLFPAIIAFASIGCYSLGLNAWDVFAVAAAGVVGYFLIRWGCEAAPLLLGFVLGPLLEENLRRAMIISRGDPSVFVTRPISATLLGLALVIVVVALLPAVRRKREVVFSGEDD